MNLPDWIEQETWDEKRWFQFFNECFVPLFDLGLLLWGDRPPSHFRTAKGYKMHRSRLWSVAGSDQSDGYRWVWFTINGRPRSIMVHRIIWLMAHRRWPADQIDHINGKRSDNRLSNLREATHSQNMGNRKAVRNGLKGVTTTRNGKPFQASIWKDGKNKYLGRFDTEAKAHEAYMLEARKIWGDFARAA